MAKRISQLTEETSVATGDNIPIYDVSTGTTKRATVANLTSTVVSDNSVTSEKLNSTIAFSAYSSANITASSTPGKIQLATEAYDQGADFDATTNYRFTAPVNGIYHFDGIVRFTTPGDGNNCQVFLYKNGAAFTENVSVNLNNGGGNSVALPVSGTVKLAATDYVELYAARTTGTGNATGTLSGFLVGRY